jgi:diguanylate cyclase (GGDEF)-like protein
MNDITDKLILQEIAIRDPLTNLYNRLKILELIQYEIEKAQRYNHVFSLLMIDIDDFKHINDTFGHNFGDEVLKEFSKCLKQSVRKIDIVSRWGGEEFLILLPETKKEQALKVANRIKENLSKVYVDYNNIVVSMNTASFGLTEYHREDNSNLLIEKVDKALYISKNNGKNKISLYS